MRKDLLNELLNSIPLDASFEVVEQIAKKYKVSAIELFLLLNDKYIKTLREDMAKEIEISTDFEPIEDWL